MSQFAFLLPSFAEVAEPARRAELFCLGEPRAACFYARRSLELLVDWIYDHDADFKRPYETHLASLLAAPTFQKQVPQPVIAKARVIKDLGNAAVHGKGAVRQSDAVAAVRELFHVAFWFARTYSKDFGHGDLQFDQTKLVVPGTAARAAQQTAEQLQKLEVELKTKDAALAAEEQRRVAASADLEAELARLRAELADLRKEAAAAKDPHDYDEATTRDHYIDLMLREAGWGLNGWTDGQNIEVEVAGMPNEKGKGYVDYVLWGDDGRPLGLVEAKRTKKDPRFGQQQAKLYADCLEQQLDCRPIIFYSNGYDTWLWDDARYPPRSVQGFLKKDELALLIERRTTKLDPATLSVSSTIVERPYQTEAIREIGVHLNGGHRKGLVVMATGAGKTRTVIALVDLLQRASWVKRVLFLADRTALVKQAANAFKAHLPDSSPVNLVTDRHGVGRVYVSTYPTMLNLIEEARSGGGDVRQFGVGHFDLIVIDEAHRSVYQKYRAIFEYFDSLLVGLTATPRDEVDRDTYGLFDLQPGLPTFSYDLDQAVQDGYLVPARAVSVPLKFQREGIKYDDLSEDEKDQWDALEWDEEGQVPTEVGAEAVNRWLFNQDTVDKVLEHLMANGQKVAGGDRLGKTIVFAKNKEHARFIEARFNVHYPHLKGSFARVIDHYEQYAQSLLDDFKVADRAPHMAISVDMLDTGIDVPEVVNLVFFKLVRSKTKFFQMLGRGTRLCRNLFGPGQDKQYFNVFDYCQNLEFFGQNPAGVESASRPALGAMIFENRLVLHQDLGAAGPRGDAALQTLRGEVADALHQEVAAMNPDNFLVRPHRRIVERFAVRPAWDSLTPEDYGLLVRSVPGLPAELPAEEETAKRFDLLLLRTQLAVLKHEPGYARLKGQVQEIVGRIAEKKDVPMVAEQLPLILEVETDEWWTNVTLPMLESVRRRLRSLVQFIDKSERRIVYTNFEDEIGPAMVREVGPVYGGVDTEQYRQKMRRFLANHLNHIAVNKLRMNKPLTPMDLDELDRLVFQTAELGSREDFLRVFGDERPVSELIRSLVGLDRKAAKDAFADFLAGSKLTADQIRFVDFIIDYLTENGVMLAERLFEPPCTDFHPAGLGGMFTDDQATRIVDILRAVQQNASGEASAA